MSVTSRLFGSSAKGPVTLFTLKSDNGISVDIIDYGATLVSLRTPDKYGNEKSIVLGYDRMEDYLEDRNYLGVIVGRYANRISNASFVLGDRKYQLPINDGPNHLHGGPGGFDKALWAATVRQSDDGCGIRLSLESPHLDQGYPGKLEVVIDYWLTPDGTFCIAMTATTDRPTYVNLASHAYFNLSDDDHIEDHLLRLFASSYLPVDDSLIPIGEIVPVAGTPFDFMTKKPIGINLGDEHPQLAIAGGYDHNFVVDGSFGALKPVAKVCEPSSGRHLLISSTQPGVQFYSGNNLTGAFKPRAGFCLETQHFPDSPNWPSFPSALVLPEKPYTEAIEYRFGKDL